MSQTLTVTTEDDLALEARIDGPEGPIGALVFCHPHPQMGGTMMAPLMEEVTQHLVGRGWAVLRFNFRGIGASGGTSGTGTGELKDATAAIAEARRRWPELPLALAGWSFGGAVAVRAAARTPKLLACVAIAPSVVAREGVSEGLPPAAEIDLDVPTLFIVGANDNVTPPDDAAAWAEQAGVTMQVLPAANHLFWGRYPQLASTIGDHLDRLLKEV